MDDSGKEEKKFDFFAKTETGQGKESVEEPKMKSADFFDSLLWSMISIYVNNIWRWSVWSFISCYIIKFNVLHENFLNEENMGN